MSESTPEPQPDDTNAQLVTEHTLFLEPDFMLSVFAASVHDDPEIEIPVTLTVGGTLITGMMVNRNRWLDAIKDMGGPSGLEGFRQVWNQEGEPGTFAYYHLINAKILFPNAMIPASGTPYRGRLSEVQGWMFGTLEAS